MQVAQHLDAEAHRELALRHHDLDAGFLHGRPAEAQHAHAGLAAAKLVDQCGGVQLARRIAGRDQHRLQSNASRGGMAAFTRSAVRSAERP